MFTHLVPPPMSTSPSTSSSDSSGPTAADASEASEAAAALPSILELSRDELTSTMLEMGEKKFRADQLWRSIYHETAESFDQMTRGAQEERPSSEVRARGRVPSSRREGRYGPGHVKLAPRDTF